MRRPSRFGHGQTPTGNPNRRSRRAAANNVPAPPVLVVDDGVPYDTDDIQAAFDQRVHPVGCICESCSAAYVREARDPRDGR